MSSLPEAAKEGDAVPNQALSPSLLIRTRRLLGRVAAVVSSQWLLVCFAVSVVVAMLWPALGKAVVSVEAGPFRLFQSLPIVIVFLLSGLSLNTDDLRKARKEWIGATWGVLTILVVTPCFGFITRELPMEPRQFAVGLTVFSAAPTTLGVGAALVRACEGNDGLATMLMTTTNLLAVFTMPLWLQALFTGGLATQGFSAAVAFDVGLMIWKLVVTVLVPSVVGKLVRERSKRARDFMKRFKQELSKVSVICLALIMWQTLSGAQSTLVKQRGGDIVLIIVAAALQHLFFLLVNGLVLRAFFFRMGIEEAVAVWIMGSQKSAPVAVSAITYITKDVATQGLLSVPCILGQLVQIFMAAIIAPVVAKHVRRVQAQRPKPAAADKASEEDVAPSLPTDQDAEEKVGLPGHGAQPTTEVEPLDGVPLGKTAVVVSEAAVVLDEAPSGKETLSV